MNAEDIIGGALKDRRRQDIAQSKLVMELLTYKANDRDHEVNNELLSQLVMKYAEAERKLNELNQLKNKFLGMAAHDLRNPLSSIRGFSEILLMELENITDEQKEFLTLINTTSDQMLRLVNDLLDVSVIESGKLDLQLKKGSIRKLVEERIKIGEVVASKKNSRISKRLSDVPEITFDANRIVQVIDNLISNAVKFSPPGSEVNVGLSMEGSEVMICVKDNGPGLSEEDKRKLFGEFQRLSAQPTGGEKSTGLGLSIAKKIIEAHKGRIWVETEKGDGALFCFVLPMGGEK